MLKETYSNFFFFKKANELPPGAGPLGWLLPLHTAAETGGSLVLASQQLANMLAGVAYPHPYLPILAPP